MFPYNPYIIQIIVKCDLKQINLSTTWHGQSSYSISLKGKRFFFYFKFLTNSSLLIGAKKVLFLWFSDNIFFSPSDPILTQLLEKKLFLEQRNPLKYNYRDLYLIGRRFFSFKFFFLRQNVLFHFPTDWAEEKRRAIKTSWEKYKNYEEKPSFR